GKRGRVYLPPNDMHASAALAAMPAWKPDLKVTTPCHDVDRLPMYGMFEWGDAFTKRQLVVLTTLSDLVGEARERIRRDAITGGQTDNGLGLDAGGSEATAYAEAVSVYLALGVSKLTDYNSSLVVWSPSRDQLKTTFSRQALSMAWDYAETNPF